MTCWLAGTTHSLQNDKDLYLSNADLLLVQVTNETLVTIFQTILSWHLETGGFPDSCRKLGPGIIAATLDMYSQCMAKLLPTPTKSHYTFNLRDFARVIQVLQRLPALCFIVILSSPPSLGPVLYCLHVLLVHSTDTALHSLLKQTAACPMHLLSQNCAD